MSNNEYTPTREQFKSLLARIPAKYGEVVAHTAVLDDFDAMIDATIAAAEQRGAEKGWVEGVLYAHERHNNYAGLSPSWKLDNPYRADQMEGDE